MASKDFGRKMSNRLSKLYQDGLISKVGKKGNYHYFINEEGVEYIDRAFTRKHIRLHEKNAENVDWSKVLNKKVRQKKQETIDDFDGTSDLFKNLVQVAQTKEKEGKNKEAVKLLKTAIDLITV